MYVGILIGTGLKMNFITFYNALIWCSIAAAVQFPHYQGITADLEKLKKLTEIKVRILNKIGLHDRPFVPNPFGNKLSGILGKRDLNGTEEEVAKPKGDYYAEMQEVVTHSQIPENFTDENIILFKVVKDMHERQLEVTSADLLVKIRYKRRRKGNKKKRKLKHILLKLSSIDSAGQPLKIISTISTQIRRTKWLKLPVPASLIEKSLKRNDQNLYLRLVCDGCDADAKLILIHTGKRTGKRRRISRRKSLHFKRKTGKHRNLKIKSRKRRRLNRTRPFLIWHTRLKTYIRSKRNICIANSSCCMDTLNVDFESFGWTDWIIAPRSFVTGFCYGTCGNERSCNETSRTHLRLVYLGRYGSIILTALPNMIVTGCGCL